MESKGTQFISNPFQVLGVSDREHSVAPVTAVPDAPIPSPPLAPLSPHLTWLHHFGSFLRVYVLPVSGDVAKAALPFALKAAVPLLMAAL